MEELTALVGTLGVPAIVVLLILDKVKGIVNGRNNRPAESPAAPGNPVVQEDLKNLLQRMFDHQEKQDGKVTKQLGQQTQVMRDISNAQTKMCTCLEKLEKRIETPQ